VVADDCKLMDAALPEEDLGVIENNQLKGNKDVR
jgi:hypothetical protein